MSETAQGTFEVKLAPLPVYHDGAGTKLGRFSIDKQFSGDLQGTSKGEMLSAGSVEKGSAGYVAIELVEGTLQGRRGTFVLQHNATMDRGRPSMSVKVVPDSGTKELTGLGGEMAIDITGGQHRYNFTYELAERTGAG